MNNEPNVNNALTLSQRLLSIVKSSRFIGFIMSILIIAVISMMFFHPDAMEGRQLQQHDVKQGIALGQEAKAFYEETGERTWWTNSLFSGMPMFQIAPSYESNSLFSWINDLFGLGLPSPSNLIFMMMFGFLILMFVMKMKWYVALIGAIAYGFSSYFIIIIGAGHIWKFVTLAYIPPTIAGIILCYRGKYIAGGALAALFAMMQITSNHIQMTYYFAFVIFGFVVAYLIKAIKTKKVKQWVVSTGVLLFAGILAISANLPSLYNTYEYSKETIRGGHSELSQAKGNENGGNAGLDRDYITQYSYGGAETFSLLIPNIKGGASAKPIGGRMSALSLTDLPEVEKLVKENKIRQHEQQVMHYLSQYFGEPEGTNGPVYVGAVICALFLLGCIIVKGPIKWMLIALTLLSIFLALGRNCMWLTDLFIDYMPMYSKFRAVESILVIAEFTMPLLAVMALQKLIVEKETWKKYSTAIYVSFGVTLLICALAILTPGIFGDVVTAQDYAISDQISQQLVQMGADKNAIFMMSLDNPQLYGAVEEIRYSMIKSDALRSFVLIAMALVVLVLVMRKKAPFWVMPVGIGVLVLFDMYSVNKRYVDHDSFSDKTLSSFIREPFPKTPADAIIEQDTALHFRVMDIPRFWSADPSYRHKMLGGYHAAKLTRYQDLIDLHLSPLCKGVKSEANMNVINMLNARYIVDHSGRVIFNNESLGNAWFVENIAYVDTPDEEMSLLSIIEPDSIAVADIKFKDILGTESEISPTDTIYLTSYAPNKLTYNATSAKGGIAVFSEIYFPWGWNVAIDGQETELGRVNYVLRALKIPAGSHEIVMTFAPESVSKTVGIAKVSIILIYVMVIASVVLYLLKYRPKQKDGQN